MRNGDTKFLHWYKRLHCPTGVIMLNKQKKILFITILLLPAWLNAATIKADLANKKTVTGETTLEKIEIRDVDGIEYSIPLEQIERLEVFSNERQGEINPKIKVSEGVFAPGELENYPVAGVTFGYPGYANFVIGYYFPRFTFQLSGLSYPSRTNTQLSVGYITHRWPSTLFSVNLVGLYYESTKKDSAYYNAETNKNYVYDQHERFVAAGFGFSFNVHGIYLEVALNFGENVLSDYDGRYVTHAPLTSFQIGYIYRFNGVDHLAALF